MKTEHVDVLVIGGSAVGLAGRSTGPGDGTVNTRSSFSRRV